MKIFYSGGSRGRNRRVPPPPQFLSTMFFNHFFLPECKKKKKTQIARESNKTTLELPGPLSGPWTLAESEFGSALVMCVLAHHLLRPLKWISWIRPCFSFKIDRIWILADWVLIAIYIAQILGIMTILFVRYAKLLQCVGAMNPWTTWADIFILANLPTQSRTRTTHTHHARARTHAHTHTHTHTHTHNKHTHFTFSIK